MEKGRKLLVILGPTAIGKTELALYLAKKFNGELISADSRQIYKGLDIVTGKLPSGRWNMDDGRWKKGNGFWILDGMKIWLYDVVDPKKQYTVFNFVKDANKVVNKIQSENKLPILVGGTGFYIKALLDGLPNLKIPVDQKLRKKLNKLSLDKLQEKLTKLSPGKWKLMNSSDKQNPRRLVRAIEVVMSKHWRDPSSLIPIQSDVLKIGLTAPRDVLYKKVDKRVVKRIKQGMIDEAKSLYKNGLSLKRMRQLGLEYGILADYLDNKIKSRKDLAKFMQFKIHGYVRRQLTYFKKEKNINWFDITAKDYINKIEKIVHPWYDANV